MPGGAEAVRAAGPPAALGTRRTLGGVSSPLAPRHWGAHLLAVVLVAAAAGLAWWQYDAYQAQREAQARDLTSAEPVALTDVMGPDDPFPGGSVGRPVSVDGTWVPTGTVLVEGKEHDGEQGYWVVTPLAVGGADAPALPVVRGWVADRDDVPGAPSGPAGVTGWLQPTDGTGQVDTDRTDDVVPQVRTADLIQHVDQDLYGAYAVLDHDTAPEPVTAGLVPADLEQLPPPAGGTGLRNLLYALEWLLFGAFAGFIWWRYVRDVTQEDPSAGAAAEDATPAPVPSEP